MALFYVSGYLRALQPMAFAANTFVVTNTNDSGSGSLRQAIMNANGNPGLDTITFSIGSGSQTIKPLGSLPVLTDPVVIDGTTQPGFSGKPLIELDGSNLVEGAGLAIVGGDSIIRSLVINRFHFTGIGIGFKGGNRVEGCYIGTDISGTIALPNETNGISISSSNNIIGGTTPLSRNVISGNSTAGIDISRPCCTGDESPVTGNVIQGNYIGVNSAGNAAIPNRSRGVRISSDNSGVPFTGHIIGGTQPGAGNVISGNRVEGLLLEGFNVKNNTVQGNFIGTDATGSFAIANEGNGVSVAGSDNLIGGSVAGAGNVISGNGCNSCAGGTGLGLGGLRNVAKNNLIGVNASLTAPIPNYGHGVAVSGTNTIVGGVAPGERNVIAFNAYDGIVDAFTTSVGNTFRGNSIFSNGFFNHPDKSSIGIDLGGSGVTLNDVGDTDAGANNLQNFPVITSVTPGANSVNVKGTLNSVASTSFILDFYANSVCDPQGYGEGARLIGSATVATNASGDASFDLNFAVTLPPGQVLTATATDPAGNTSEFSQCSVSAAPSAGSVSFSSTEVAVDEGAGTVSLTLTRTGGSAGTLTIGYTVVGITATAGSDFATTQGTVTFADGETVKTINVNILEDSVSEPFTEIAKVMLSTSGELDTLGSQSTATLVIEDNDPRPGVTIGDASFAEGDTGTTAFTFAVKLSAPSALAVTVSFNVTDGTAVAGSDYVLPNANAAFITIPAGQSESAVTIQVNGDTSIEPDETFFVNLRSATNGKIVDGQGKGTILDDDTHLPPPLQLLLDETGPGANQAAALDSVLFLRDPFPVINTANLLGQDADRNTRVIVFVTNLQLAQDENSSSVVVNLTDSNGQPYDIPAEEVRVVPGFNFTQVVFRLPDNPAPGTCTVKVKAHGQESNAGTIRIGS